MTTAVFGEVLPVRVTFSVFIRSLFLGSKISSEILEEFVADPVGVGVSFWARDGEGMGRASRAVLAFHIPKVIMNPRLTPRTTAKMTSFFMCGKILSYPQRKSRNWKLWGLIGKFLV